MTALERSLVAQAADSLMAHEGPSAERIFNDAGVPWRRAVSLMVATLKLARERGMPTTDERHRSAGIANARVRWGRIAGRGA